MAAPQPAGPGPDDLLDEQVRYYRPGPPSTTTGSPGAGATTGAFRIVKVFRGAEELAARLTALGWAPDLGETATYFVDGTAALSPATTRG